MPEVVAPNPASPFADAGPRFRHILGFFLLLGTPKPGALAPTMCGRLAVVPTEPLRRVTNERVLPDGLCPNCRRALAHFDHDMPTRPYADCRSCGDLTEHDGICENCRQNLHTRWVAAGRPWRALTVKQPYADAIVHTTHPTLGRKTVENRTWPAPAEHHGTRILIHAGKTADRRALDAGILPGPDARGAIIGTAILAGCHLQSAAYCDLIGCGPWAEDEVFHWQLADVRPLKTPVPAKGALQLWKPTVNVLAMVIDQEAARTPATAAPTTTAGTDGATR